MSIGPHINRNFVEKGTILENIKKCLSLIPENVNVISLFVSMPRAKKIIVKESDIKELRELSKQYTIIAHSSYVANPWNGNQESIDFIKHELEVCIECGIKGLVVHLPASGLENVMKYIGNFKISTAIKLYLETPAVIESHFDTPKKINVLFEEIKRIDPNLEYFGICIDTAHLHTNGIVMKTYENMNLYLTSLIKYIPIENIMFHLNDSRNELNHGPDKHDALMQGKIWTDTDIKHNGLTCIVEFIRKYNIPTILERDENSLIIDDYKLLKYMA